jgi:hypothetical protein
MCISQHRRLAWNLSIFFNFFLAKSFWDNTKCYLKATLIASKRFCKVTPCVTLKQLNFMLSSNKPTLSSSKTSLACPKITCTYNPMAQTCKTSWTPTHHGLSSYATMVVLTWGPLYAKWTCTKGACRGVEWFSSSKPHILKLWRKDFVP